MDSKRFCIVAGALVGLAVVLGATGHSAMAEECDHWWYSDGFVMLEEGV